MVICDLCEEIRKSGSSIPKFVQKVAIAYKPEMSIAPESYFEAELTMCDDCNKKLLIAVRAAVNTAIHELRSPNHISKAGF